MLARGFGERLHRYREDRGLSQRQLAEQVGVDQSQIGRYERGLILPAADTVVAIAEALRISTDTLLLGKADRQGQDLPVKNLVLLERFEELAALDRREQQIILEILDSLLARRRIEGSANARRRTAAR